jgi:hypothetical protein
VKHVRGWRPPLLMQSGAPPFDEDVLDPDCSMAAQSLHLYTAGYRFHVLPQVSGAADFVAPPHRHPHSSPGPSTEPFALGF